MAERTTRIQLRRAAAQATFEANNPVLLAGEPAIALDTGILKIGDGVSTYTQLPEIGASPDLSDYVTRTELATDLEDYVESSDLAAVATSGSYNDLLNKPSIPAAQVQSDWNQSDSSAVDFIKNKPTIPSTSGFVDTTTNQTVGGTKIFSESLGVQNSNGAIVGISNGTYQVALGIDSNGKAGISCTNVNDWKIYTTSTDFLLDTSMLDGTTLSYDNVNNVINVNSANKDLSNLSSTGQKVLDGQWTPINHQLANNVAWDNTVTEATYDISSYLPHDSYNYEVMISGQATASATQQKFCTIQIKSDIQTSYLYVTSARAVTTSGINEIASANTIIPVGTGRYITQYASTSSNAGGAYSLWIKGYRRIGTNS